MTGVSEYSQQRGNLKDNGYIMDGNDSSLIERKYIQYVTIDCDVITAMLH
ncbi:MULTISPECIES: hypothetical protein [Photorhabdus]|nr:hypothetical protein [Photorhabdus asymbiotica]